MDELERRLQAPAQPGAPGGASSVPRVGSGNDGYFRVPAGTPPADNGGRTQPALPVSMIETFELEGAPRSSADDARSGPELVADSVAKPVSAWLPAGAHASAIVLAGVDASAGISSRAIPDRC